MRPWKLMEWAFLIFMRVSILSFCTESKTRLLRRELEGPAYDHKPGSMIKPRIPRQLILTGPVDSLQEMSALVQRKVQLLLNRDPDMELHWLGDKLCAEYISQHSSKKLLYAFNHEPRGALRGDICRTAVLFREGGYYIDLDVELLLPMHKLVDKSTSFMSVFESFADDQGPSGGILNAIMAVEPGSRVLKQTLKHIEKWYQRGRFGPHPDRMGPLTLSTGLMQVMRQDCPSEWKQQLRTANPVSKWKCGPHAFQFYAQRRLHCAEKQDYGPEVCTAARRNASDSWQWWLDFGVFALDGDAKARQLIAFPHAEWCSELGCKLGGHTEDNRSLERLQ